MDAVFQAENFSDFPGDFRPNSCSFQWETVGSHRDNSTIFPSGVVLPFSIDFRGFPANHRSGI
jgi:hypothetical protein